MIVTRPAEREDIIYAKNVLISSIESWGIEQDVKPVEGFHEFGGAAQAQRYRHIGNYIAALDENLYHQRIHGMISLGNSFFMAVRGAPTREKMADAIETLIGVFTQGSPPSGFESFAFMVQDAIVLASIYTSHVAP